ncbi:MAG: hypothetical protein COW88_01865 [Candidatus Lloydbacteria bacterium CG22_combo_CG10-13_8_21_14_all_47_15]|uniref:Ribonuclease P protein component n=1 Tax=Candidatus Lloydbacteria bacterium CG22_combo_CG10-13_8_21_14_all_47_15 TaxID=1974635 RepID=A0A2H0CU49_9BACT|nr:MAG: hypothetical protein COW88_01865 [Candidatus Lloydbacteria bacterium CG22_combo_CG10-13_8_21_14_all_47_15]
MLKKKKRLTTKDFNGVFRESRVLHSKYLTLRYSRVTGTAPFLGSIVVSKKIANSAVLRNKFRRIGYIFFERISNTLKQNTACIFFLKKDAMTLSEVDLSSEMRILLEKAGLVA